MPLPLFKLQLHEHKCILDEYEAILGYLSYWQRVKHNWFKMILISDWTHTARELYRSSAARHAEKDRHLMSPNYYIIHPLSNLRLLWQMLMIVVLCGTLIIVARMYSMYVYGVDESSQHGEGQNYDSYVLLGFQLILFVDIIMNFFTGYRVKGTSEIVLDPRRIARRYLRTFFLIDVLSTVPVDKAIDLWFPFVWDGYKYPYHTYIAAIIITMAFMKMFRIPTLLFYIQQVSKAFRVPLFVQRSIIMFMVFVQFLSWTSCFTYLLPHAIHGPQLTNRSSPDFGRSWIHRVGLFNETADTKFKESITRTISIISCIGMCETKNYSFIEEMIDRPLMVLIGRIFYAFLFASILYKTLSYFDSETKYCNMMDELEAFMYHTFVPTKVRHRMRTYYKYCYQQKFYRAHTIQTAMPVLLRREMDMIACRRLIISVALFKDLPRNVLSNIVSSLTQEIFLEDDVIITHGTLGNCMYFIASGTVAVCVPVTEGDRCFHKELCHLVDGDHFGEVALMELVQPRNGTVVALETTTCYRLDGEDFYTIIDSDKELFNRVSEISQQRSNIARRLEALP